MNLRYIVVEVIFSVFAYLTTIDFNLFPVIKKFFHVLLHVYIHAQCDSSVMVFFQYDECAPRASCLVFNIAVAQKEIGNDRYSIFFSDKRIKGWRFRNSARLNLSKLFSHQATNSQRNTNEI